MNIMEVEMAGIGFELNKLFKGKSFIENIAAYSVSTAVTVGPMILCILLTTVLQRFLIAAKVAFSVRELFQATTIYAFVFSLVVASSMIMLISRYIADQLFQKKYERIMSSLYGVLSFTLVIGGIIGFVFLSFSPMSFFFKLSAYLFYMELIIIWIQSIYISLFKDYLKILRGFLYGVSTSIILGYIVVFHTNFEPVLGLMISIDIGFFIIVASYMQYFIKYLSENDRNIFRFIGYFDKYPSLIAISLFYNIGMYSHNFVYWLGDYSVTIGETFRFSPIYDVPMFYAYFTITPTLVLFVVTVETSFYIKYKNYYNCILKDGNLQEITTAKKEMSSVLVQEISYIMEIQLVFSILSLIVGRKYLPLVGLVGLSIDIFSILVLGCYLFIMMFILVLILLYFDDRKGALFSVTIFIITNFALTKITMDMGQTYFGTGFFLSSLISLIIAITRLAYYIKNIDYYIFCSQPILYKEKTGLFSRLIDKMDRGEGK